MARRLCIEVFSNGRHSRDFTYIDDVVEGVVRTLDKTATADPAWSAESPRPDTSNTPYRVYNIGNSNPVELQVFIRLIEEATGKTAIKTLLPAQPGDVAKTHANIESLHDAVGFRPNTPIETGIRRFVAWYRDYYRV